MYPLVICIVPSIGIKLSFAIVLYVSVLYNTQSWSWPAFLLSSVIIGLIQILIGCVLIQREKVKEIQQRLNRDLIRKPHNEPN